MRMIPLLIAALLTWGCHAKPEGVRELSYASPYGDTHPFSRADITWMKWVERESGGRLKIKPHWGGHLLSSNDNMTEIRHGVADIGMITPMYARSAHLQRVQQSFYTGIDTIEQQYDIYKCLEREFPYLNSEVRGLHILALQGGNFPGILTRTRPVRTLADLRGLRLRAQADTADVLRAFGADPVNMSMAEVYPAMARGVIDGVVAPTDSLRSVHLADVGRYFSTLKIPRGAYPARAMSQRLWDSLTPQERDILSRSQKVWEKAMIAQLHKALTVGLDYAREEKLNMIPMPEAEQARFRALYRANALRLGEQVRRYGVDGVPIVERAAQIIGSGGAGCPATVTSAEAQR